MKVRAKPRRRAVISVLGLTAAFTVLPAAVASAEARGNASCMGFEASALSPPGSSEEAPAGMPGLKQFISETFPDTPPGAIYGWIAKLHEGSHEGCDAVIDG